MTTPIRTARRTSYPALMIFATVYLAALAVVVAPSGFRAGAGLGASTSSPSTP